jgi:hypothetical protein
VVRVRYTCTEELNKQLNRKALERSLYDAGVFFVSEIKGDIARGDRSRDASVNESIGPIDALRKWSVNQGMEIHEINELAEMAGQLLIELNTKC